MDFNVVGETAGNRLQVISRPLTGPGCCAICGYNGTNTNNPADVRVFLDFQLDIDYYGRIYWCSGCLLEAANALGWTSVGQTEELRGKVSEQESELIVLREQNERLRSSLSSLLGQSDNSSVDIMLDSPEVLGAGDESSEGTIIDSEQSESSSDELVSVERPDGISSDSSNESNDFGEFKL